MRRSRPSPPPAKPQITGRARGLRGLLRAGQPAPHQRALRRPPHPHAGAGDRRADPVGRDRRRLFPGDASAGAVPRSAASIASWSPIPRQMPYVLENAIRAAVGPARRGRRRDPRRRRPASRRRSAASRRAPACCRPRPSSRPPTPNSTRWPTCSNGAKRVTLFCGRGCAGAHDAADGSWPRR